jgi:transcriptional regulator with XRE-family HTH domain
MLQQKQTASMPWNATRCQQLGLRNQQIYDRYQEGWSQVAIALEFGISQSRVSQILECQGNRRSQYDVQHQWALQIDFAGATLRNARLEAGMTRRDLACLLGVSEVVVGNWERGKQRIPAKRVEQLHYSLLKPYLPTSGEAAAIERHAA